MIVEIGHGPFLVFPDIEKDVDISLGTELTFQEMSMEGMYRIELEPFEGAEEMKKFSRDYYDIPGCDKFIYFCREGMIKIFNKVPSIIYYKKVI